MRLAEACTIHSGYTARSRLEEGGAAGVLAIQLRNIAPDGGIEPDRLARVELDELADRYFVNAGDVVFRSRGERNTATALDVRFSEPAVAVLPLIVLRPRPQVVTAEYLAWAINQPAAQRHFDTTARGTSLRMVPKSSLDELDIDIPDLATQRQIVQIDGLAEREKELSILVAEKRRRLASLILGEQARSIRHGSNSERTKK